VNFTRLKNIKKSIALVAIIAEIDTAKKRAVFMHLMVSASAKRRLTCVAAPVLRRQTPVN
jgi:hypothetical protein